MFPDSLDHLAEVQHLIHQGAGQEQGRPQRLIFGKVAVIGVVQDVHIAHLKVFLDNQDHLAEVQYQRHQGEGQEQGHPQGLFFFGGKL